MKAILAYLCIAFVLAVFIAALYQGGRMKGRAEGKAGADLWYAAHVPISPALPLSTPAFRIDNVRDGGVTVSASDGNINGLSAFVIPPGAACVIYSKDDTEFRAICVANQKP